MAWERFRRGKPRERCRRRSPRRTRLEQVGATGSDPAVKPRKDRKISVSSAPRNECRLESGDRTIAIHEARRP